MTHPMLAVAGEEITPTTAIAMVHGAPPSILPAPLEELDWTASMLCRSGIVPHLKDNPGRSMAVAYTAARLGMDAVGFGMKTYFAKLDGPMAYEAQLVVAILYKLAPLVGRLDISYNGAGSQRTCTVVGRIRGVRKPKVYTSPIIGQIKPKNSPLWFTDPDQQLAYYSQRAWGRRYTPEALLGVYDREELIDVGQETNDREAAIRADPFNEEELGAPEPSGGSGWGETVREMRGPGDDEPPPRGRPAQRDQRGAGRRDDAKSPADHQEPAGLADDRVWAFQEQTRILAMMQPELIGGAWAAMAAEPAFGRIVSYDQPLANQIKARIAAHKKNPQPPRVAEGSEVSDFPGDR